MNEAALTVSQLFVINTLLQSDDDHHRAAFFMMAWEQKGRLRTAQLMAVAASLLTLVEALRKRDDRAHFPLQITTPRTAEEIADYLTPTLWNNYFRFTREQFCSELVPVLELPEYFCDDGHTVHAKLGVLMLIAYMSSPRQLGTDMVILFLHDRTRTGRFIKQAAQHIFLKFHHTLAFDVEYIRRRLRRFSVAIAWEADVREGTLLEEWRSWGFIDGNLIKVANPTNSAMQNAIHSGYKKSCGYKFQIIITPDGMIADVSGPYGGAVSDSDMSRRSKLRERLLTFVDVPIPVEYRIPGGPAVRRMKLFGDSGYGQSDVVDRPFPRRLMTPGQENYNALLSRVRVSVENAIGSIVNTFRSFGYTYAMKTGESSVAMKYLVSVILRNFLTVIRGHNQVSKFFRLTPPTLQQFARPRRDVHPRVQELFL